MMKQLAAAIGTILISVSMLAGCGSGNPETTADNAEITVVSREEGSGTRGAFVELFGMEVDSITEDAQITNSTSVVMITIAGNPDAVGYISLGSLNDTVKAVTIDGVKATKETIKSGAYKISRPFIIVTKSELSETAGDFIDFIMSREGQTIVEKRGYVSVNDNAKSYAGNAPAGKIVIAGSSSVTPVMESLKEAYLDINTDAVIEIQQSDSTTGIASVASGICDIGMVSRELKDAETDEGLQVTKIALDGLAVIVNKNNKINDMAANEVASVYCGDTKLWSDVK